MMDWKKVVAIGIPVLTLLAVGLQLYHTQKQIKLAEEREKQMLKEHELDNTATAEVLQGQINSLQKQVSDLRGNRVYS